MSIVLRAPRPPSSRRQGVSYARGTLFRACLRVRVDLMDLIDLMVSYERGTLLSLLILRLTNPIVEAPHTKSVRELELTPQIRPGIGAVAFAITETFWSAQQRCEKPTSGVR